MISEINPPADEGLSSPVSDPVRRSRGRVWIRLLLALVALPVGYYLFALAWQNWLGPQVDPQLTQSVDIRQGHVVDAEAIDVEKQKLPGILAPLTVAALQQSGQPLDLVLEIAGNALAHLRKTVVDYRCVMMSEIVLDGKVREPQYMFCKIRQEQARDGETVPFSVYGRFLKPQSLLGQEVIWIKGQNGGLLVAHPPGFLNVSRFWLDPNGMIAMRGNRYPLSEIGLENLLLTMIERGERDRAYGLCEVTFNADVKVDGRPCVMLEIKHPKKEGPYDFHLARIYVDVERQIPLGYEGFDWPAAPDAPPPLIERFFYSNLELNVGLKDVDFDPDNPEYKFPGG